MSLKPNDLYLFIEMTLKTLDEMQLFYIFTINILSLSLADMIKKLLTGCIVQKKCLLLVELLRHPHSAGPDLHLLWMPADPAFSAQLEFLPGPLHF